MLTHTSDRDEQRSNLKETEEEDETSKKRKRKGSEESDKDCEPEQLASTPTEELGTTPTEELATTPTEKVAVSDKPIGVEPMTVLRSETLAYEQWQKNKEM